MNLNVCTCFSNKYDFLMNNLDETPMKLNSYTNITNEEQQDEPIQIKPIIESEPNTTKPVVHSEPVQPKPQEKPKPSNSNPPKKPCIPSLNCP